MEITTKLDDAESVTPIFKGDGVVYIGYRFEGHEVEVCYPSHSWDEDLRGYFGELAVSNPDAKITISWIDSPTFNFQRGEVSGKFRVYDGNLYK